MIELYTIMHGIYSSDACPKLELNCLYKTRGHSYKLFKRSCLTNTRKNYFSFRVVDKWNSLPNEIVTAPSINSFKNRLDKHWACQDIVFNYRSSFLLTAGQRTGAFKCVFFNFFDLDIRALVWPASKSFYVTPHWHWDWVTLNTPLAPSEAHRLHLWRPH